MTGFPIHKGGHNDLPEYLERPAPPAPFRAKGRALESKWDFGDRVWIDGEGSIEAVVTALQFRSDRAPMVELSWIHNGTNQVAWFEDWRLTKVR